MDRRQLLFIGIPVAGLTLLAAVVFLRRSGESEPGKPHSSGPTATSVYSSARVEAAPPPASPEKIAQATETVRIRGTYQNFRRAVATNDPELQKTLLPVLLKDRQAALRCADEDLARATSDQDRTVARKVGEALRK